MCDKEIGEKFLPHQLKYGTSYTDREKIPVTLGFQPNICNTCRRQLEIPSPKAQLHGSTSKIQRYYWREILLQTMIKFDNWLTSKGIIYDHKTRIKYKKKYQEIRKNVLEEIKKTHDSSPKYNYIEKSQQRIIEENNIEIVDLYAFYEKINKGRIRIKEDNKYFTVEEFVAKYYSQKGYKVIQTESTPFHVLFGVFFWLVIQDPSDPKNRLAGFGDRNAYDNKEKGVSIYTLLPADFGTSGYYIRRKLDIEDHFNIIGNTHEDVLDSFEYWLDYSSKLRNYLWAHREKDIEKARQILKILSISDLKRILIYLIENYWDHYLGWPDLLIYNNNEYFFAEVKSSGDKLSENQKKWIENNTLKLQLDFRVIKVLRKQDNT